MDPILKTEYNEMEDEILHPNEGDGEDEKEE